MYLSSKSRANCIGEKRFAFLDILTRMLYFIYLLKSGWKVTFVK